MTKRVDDITKAEIVDLYTRGNVDISDLRIEFGLSNAAIYKILSDAGIPLRGRIGALSGLTNEDIEAFIKKYNAFTPIDQLAKEYGLTSNSQVYNLLKHLGVPTRTHTEENRSGKEAQILHAIELYQKGLKLWEIWRETGVDQPRLSKELHLRGIPMRNKRWVESERRRD